LHVAKHEITTFQDANARYEQSSENIGRPFVRV